MKNMENKQTALQGFIEALTSSGYVIINQTLIDTYLAMEKEQMIDFMDDYINNCCYVTKIGDIGCNKTTEQYYNETYNK